MPNGVPVATVALNAAQNAGILAAQILGCQQPEVQEKVVAFKQSLENSVRRKFEKLEKQHRDIPLAFYTQPTLIEHAANSFRDTDQIMTFFEEEIGVPFPWNKYYQVTIRDFVAGGMENTTLTTLTHRTIFSDETENIRTTRG